MKTNKTAAFSRSAIMRAVKSKNTTPEMTVRRMLHAAGYRFRLHSVDLPGKPDLLFRSRRKVIFVNGCFWHGHQCKRGHREPKTNTAYWRAKIEKNVARDQDNANKLNELGWSFFYVWECQLKSANMELLKAELIAFLEDRQINNNAANSDLCRL